MRWFAFIVAITLIGSANPAVAHLDRASLNAIGAWPGPLARLPSDLVLMDEQGARLTSGALLSADAPTALVFVDYHCRNLCGVGLPLLIDAFERTDPHACNIAAMSLDPAALPGDAVSFRRAHFPHTPCQVRLLMGEAPVIAAATRALGYRYSRDPDTGDFAHDASTYILRPDGGVAALVSEFALQTGTLKTALASARRPEGMFSAAWRCVCYALDPANGVYTGAILLALQLSGLALLAFGACVFWRLIRKQRHAA